MRQPQVVDDQKMGDRYAGEGFAAAPTAAVSADSAADAHAADVNCIPRGWGSPDGRGSGEPGSPAKAASRCRRCPTRSAEPNQ